MDYVRKNENDGSGLSEWSQNNPRLLKEVMHLVKEQVMAYEHQKTMEEERRVVLKTATAIEFVAIADIIRCEAEGRYTNVFYEEDAFLMVSMHLKEIEKLLHSRFFLRCHNSHIINKMKIRRFNKVDGGFFELLNGDQVPVARARKEYVMSQLNNEKNPIDKA